tara:strand:+ start:1150 stop:1425 length:276 start_codon:yes stop_codon:yes gene_type:complete
MEYELKAIQGIKLVLARYGSSAQLGKPEQREVIANEIWKSILQITGYHNALTDEEDIQLGASIVESNDKVSGVFMSEGKVKQVDYFGDNEE